MPDFFLRYAPGAAGGALSRLDAPNAGIDQSSGGPQIDAAFARGEISYSKVRAITRAATPDNEAYLLHFARHGTAHHVEKLIAGFRRVKRLQTASEEKEPRELREVTSRWDEDGCLVVTARLPAERGALLLKALDLAVDCAGEREHAAAAEVLKDAVPEYGSRGVTAETLKEGASDLEHLEHAPRVTAETRALKGLALPRLDAGPGVAAETSRRLACDCSIVPVFKGIEGEPLSVGRKTRAIPPAIMRALRIRDGRCRFPGCTHSRFVDVHYIRHWANQGETALDNLVLLCRYHHRLVHEGGFGCERDAHGEIVFTSPRGNVIPPAFEMTAPPSVNEPVAWIAGQVDCDHIDATTCVTKWCGERCDWGLAVRHPFVDEGPPQYAMLFSSA